MENSILTSTKKILGIDENYTAFDQDIITHINAALSTMNQLGLGPIEGFAIEDATQVWSELMLPLTILGMAKPYVFLKTRMLFDPPATSFHIEAMNKQIDQFEWRMNVERERLMHEMGLV